MIAHTQSGICNLKFLRENTQQEMKKFLTSQWPSADIILDNKNVKTLAETVFPFKTQDSPAPIHLYIKGTNFQIKVWEALTKIPFGSTVTYQDIAKHIGLPGANRAVGTAIGKNPVPFLIPCHRVIRKMGQFGNYGGGKARKKALIGWEAAKRKT